MGVDITKFRVYLILVANSHQGFVILGFNTTLHVHLKQPLLPSQR